MSNKEMSRIIFMYLDSVTNGQEVYVSGHLYWTGSYVSGHLYWQGGILSESHLTRPLVIVIAF